MQHLYILLSTILHSNATKLLSVVVSAGDADKLKPERLLGRVRYQNNRICM